MKVRGEASVPQPDRPWRTKAVNYGRLVGTAPAFVLLDICSMSPAASWRLWLTAGTMQARPRPTFSGF